MRLSDAWKEILARRSPSAEPSGELDAATRLLGELTAAGVLLQASIKFDGTLVLQIFGDGPLKLAVVEVTADLALRSTSKLVGVLPDRPTLQQMVNVNGQGRCAVTLDPKDKRPGQVPYQGVVSLSAGPGVNTLAQVVERYLHDSEQVDSTLVLAANRDLVLGLLVQRLPQQGGVMAAAPRGEDQGLEDYRRIALLSASLSPEEFLTWDVPTLLRRLFSQEPCRWLAPDTGEPVPHFACSCSREQVSSMLLSLGSSEADAILRERGLIEVGCEFCGRRYHYDAVDAAQIFKPNLDQPPSSEAVQ